MIRDMSHMQAISSNKGGHYSTLEIELARTIIDMDAKLQDAHVRIHNIPPLLPIGELLQRLKDQTGEDYGTKAVELAEAQIEITHLKRDNARLVEVVYSKEVAPGFATGGHWPTPPPDIDTVEHMDVSGRKLGDVPSRYAGDYLTNLPIDNDSTPEDERERPAEQNVMSWDFCQQLADKAEVDAALRELVEDTTNDNGVRVVMAVLQALRPPC